MKRHLLILTSFVLPVAAVFAQTEPLADAEEAPERIQYTLFLPEEKNPELIKTEENNPFEATVNQNEKEGDTEENRVRDILLQMPAKGGGNGPAGMRVMLGSMRLEAGQMVPDVLPDQQVKLKVKTITPKQIEMVWVENKPTGLPPKPFVIDVDVSPRVRYKMPSPGAADGGGIGTMRMAGISAFTREEVVSRPLPVNEQTAPVKAVAMDEKPDVSPPHPHAPASKAHLLRICLKLPCCGCSSGIMLPKANEASKSRFSFSSLWFYCHGAVDCSGTRCSHSWQHCCRLRYTSSDAYRGGGTRDGATRCSQDGGICLPGNIWNHPECGDCAQLRDDGSGGGTQRNLSRRHSRCYGGFLPSARWCEHLQTSHHFLQSSAAR